MSYKIEVLEEKDWRTNALRFATKEEAIEYSKQALLWWLGAKDTRVAESEEPVNSIMENGKARTLY